MKDPTRIPAVMRALEEAWLGQYDLSFGAFVEVLQNHGLSWSSTDEELLEKLTQMRDLYPSRLAPDADGYFITTESPKARFFVTDGYLVKCGERPSAWPIRELTRAEIAQPLRVTDSDGHEHRYGVVTRVGKPEDPMQRIFVLEDGLVTATPLGMGNLYLKERRGTRHYRDQVITGPGVVWMNLYELSVKKVLWMDSWWEDARSDPYSTNPR